MKKVCIRSYSGPYFAAVRLNTEGYSVCLRIQSECEKIRTRITPNTDTVYVVFSVYEIGLSDSRNGKVTVQKKKFSIKDFFTKYDQIRRKLRIWSHLLKKSYMENFIFCTVS